MDNPYINRDHNEESHSIFINTIGFSKEIFLY